MFFRTLSYIIFLILALVIIAFAANNYHNVVVSLFPISYSIELPLALVVVITMLMGFLLGGISYWLVATRKKLRLYRKSQANVSKKHQQKNHNQEKYKDILKIEYSNNSSN